VLLCLPIKVINFKKSDDKKSLLRYYSIASSHDNLLHKIFVKKMSLRFANKNSICIGDSFPKASTFIRPNHQMGTH